MNSLLSKKNMSNQNGQSIIEFIVFLPVFMGLFIALTRFQASLNASINQQKAVRGYFYARVNNNSFYPDAPTINQIGSNTGAQNFGLTVMGFKDYSTDAEETGSTSPYSSCFRLAGMGVSDEATDECTDAISGKTEIRHIRVYTAYGFCTATYSYSNGRAVYNPLNAGSVASCTNQ